MNPCIRCIYCNKVFIKTPFDQSPEYQYDPRFSSVTFQSIEKDDYQDFLKEHQGHPLEYLEIIEDSYISEQPYSEPVKVSYVKATNGKEKFVIKKFRENIEDPLRYELILGDYSLELQEIEIQSKEIAQQLKTEFQKHPLSPTQISKFIKLYQRIVEGMDLLQLEPISEESYHPLERYYKLDDVSLYYLLRNCRNIFKGKEYEAMEGFIFRHKDEGVLLLKARYKIQMIKKEKRKEEAFPRVVLTETKKVERKK